MASKKEKNMREQAEERFKAELEAHRKEAKEHKELMMPLARFLKSKQLKFSHALVRNQRVEFFRLDEYEKIVEKNKQQIEKNEKLAGLFKNATSEFIFFRRPDHIKVKYPKVLEPVLPNSTEKKYASFRFDTTESKHGMTILIILGILALVMFPIWPYEVKYGVWLISLILLIIMVGLIVIRLVVYLLVVGFNYHVWIFPNLLNSPGFLESFIPVIEISKGDKSWFNVFIRLFAISSFMLLVLHTYLNPTFIDDNIAFTTETIKDVHDWGVGKLKNEGNFSQRALTNLQTILNETADVHQQPEGLFEDNNQEIDLQEEEIVLSSKEDGHPQMPQSTQF